MSATRRLPLLVVRRIEAAASHQTRALHALRETQAAHERMSAARRQSLQVRALEHLLNAQRLLQEAKRTVPSDADLAAPLDAHLARLEQMVLSVQKLAAAEVAVESDR